MNPADGPDEPQVGADGLVEVSDTEAFADVVAAGPQPVIRVAGGRLAEH